MGPSNQNSTQPHAFPGAVGETGQLLLITDWSRTPLGPISHWSRALVGYVSMIMAMPMPAIIFWGPEQTQIYNDGYALIMGPRHPRFFGGTYRESWPDTYPLIHPHMQRVLKRGETWTVDRALIPVTRHGFLEEAYFSFTFSPLRDDDGTIKGVLQPVFEVTPSVVGDRRAETLRLLVPDRYDGAEPLDEALAAIERNPRDLPCARVWVWDRASRKLVLARHTGAAPSEAEAARLDRAAFDVWASGTPVELAAEEDSAGWQRVQLSLLEGAADRSAEGVIALGVSSQLHFDARYQEFLQLVSRQFAAGLQRVRALQAEAQHRDHLNELFLQAPAGIAITQGPEHVFELVNPAYELFSGHRGLAGRALREAMPELRDQAFPSLLDEVYRTGRPYVGTEVSAMLRRGADDQLEEAFFNFVYQPLRGKDGAINGILIFSYEVTGQVQARLRAEALTDELRDEQRRKDDFLAMLAHELRNPLAPISAAAHVLRQDPAGGERLRRTTDIVTRQVRHMTSLIDDLLDVSRVTRGLVTIVCEPEDLRVLVETAVEQVRPLMERRRHRLVVERGDGRLTVLGDRKRLVQVLANLLDNAVKYTPEGGEIRLSVQSEGEDAVLRVQDSGMGIPAELQPRVFDLFVQGARNLDRGQGGLGIGLALVRTLVDLHGGAVTCFSAGAGLGTTFIVRLPLSHLEAAPARMPSVSPMPRGSEPAGPERGLRVLIVDDNVDAARMLAMLIEESGHEALVEHQPFSALERVSQAVPDLCLLDIGLPGMDGHELAQRLRRLPRGGQAEMVALTGYGEGANRSRAFAAGFDHFLVKPLDPEALVALLAQACARVRA